MTDLRLLACLVLSGMVVGAYSAPMGKERIFLPADVTSVVDDSPINEAATQVGLQGQQQTVPGPSPRPAGNGSKIWLEFINQLPPSRKERPLHLQTMYQRELTPPARCASLCSAMCYPTTTRRCPRRG